MRITCDDGSAAQRAATTDSPAGESDEALYERERGFGDLAPAAVDRQRVPSPGHLRDLGDARVVALALVGGVGDRPRHGVVAVGRDDEQRSARRVPASTLASVPGLRLA